MLTAQRRDEVGGMRRAEIDGKVWKIPSERTKNHLEHWVPLPGLALGIANDSAHLTNRDYLFGRGPRREGDRQRGFSGWSKAKAALDARIPAAHRGTKPMPPWRLHDLRRRTFGRQYKRERHRGGEIWLGVSGRAIPVRCGGTLLLAGLLPQRIGAVG
jgi:integrase